LVTFGDGKKKRMHSSKFAFAGENNARAPQRAEQDPSTEQALGCPHRFRGITGPFLDDGEVNPFTGFSRPIPLQVERH